MITGELRNKVDRVWETFWIGGIANTLDVIEAIGADIQKEFAKIWICRNEEMKTLRYKKL